MSSLPRIIVKHPTSLMPGELIQKTTAESLCKAASQHYCPCLLNNRKVTCLFTFNLEAQTSLSFTTQWPLLPLLSWLWILCPCEPGCHVWVWPKMERSPRLDWQVQPSKCMVGLLLILLEKSLFLFCLWGVCKEWVFGFLREGGNLQWLFPLLVQNCMIVHVWGNHTWAFSEGRGAALKASRPARG